MARTGGSVTYPAFTRDGATGMKWCDVGAIALCRCVDKWEEFAGVVKNATYAIAGVLVRISATVVLFAGQHVDLNYI
jgi:hypothetical protein